MLKTFYWDLRDPVVRKDYLYEFVRNLPGRIGFFIAGKSSTERI